MRGGLGGGIMFELLGEGGGGGTGRIPLWIAVLFVGGVVKQRIFPTSTYRSSWSV